MILGYMGKSPRIHPSVFIAEGARVIGDVGIGADSSVWFNSVVRGDVHSIRIGERTNVQDLCILHVTKDRHDLVIGDDVTIGHRAVVHGCNVADKCLIGMGSVILDGATIGEGSIIAAGAVVLEGAEIPKNSLAIGVPAKVRRQLEDNETRYIIQSAKNYVEFSNNYKQGR